MMQAMRTQGKVAPSKLIKKVYILKSQTHKKYIVHLFFLSFILFFFFLLRNCNLSACAMKSELSHLSTTHYMISRKTKETFFFAAGINPHIPWLQVNLLYIFFIFCALPPFRSTLLKISFMAHRKQQEVRCIKKRFYAHNQREGVPMPILKMKMMTMMIGS